ncbi:E3 SUMO-protein ligase ZNF451 [Spea bombifrons]|uniref:E3 SUMO-protein ligase ZNF451 n=1 Tax=Spea bombifrons TaxID=233779 RepID=UPI0023497E47|nr:E3 SUMO-protein ligase ZNF451 [Spea bombifrons]
MDLSVPSKDDTTNPEGSRCTDDEVEFVCEAPLRPVLECVNLLSSDDDDDMLTCYRVPTRVKDHIDHQKDRVSSTLDRLARHVEIEKQQREERNKAFQEKIHHQHAHGLQELEFIKDHPGTDAARLCVNQWLKVPGPRPGTVSASRRPVLACSERAPTNTTSITCPVMHCNKKFDNGQLLLGHLKRFDHSPCDPSITLHGAPAVSYACVLCRLRFPSMKGYTEHLSQKAKLADGHEKNLPAQTIQCFACPKCFLLFNLRDECLQHMTLQNHLGRAFKFVGEKATAYPIPLPSYAKKVLLALCKDVPYRVCCTSCRSELRSHMDLTAHFRTRCRNAGPASLSEMSIAEVAAVFRVKALCAVCRQVLNSDAHVTKHFERTKHRGKIITNMEESILAFCYLNEGVRTVADFCLSASNARLKPLLKRTLKSDRPSTPLMKRSRDTKKESSESFVMTVTAWFCECLKKFATEPEVEKHIMEENKICHKCMVCGKLAGDLSIIHLHMSRFHGGAHLNNFRYWCKACNTQIPGLKDMMLHVTDYHGGHSYYFEQDTPEEQPLPSTSATRQSPPISRAAASTARGPGSGKWQCHICEEMFDSEETVKQHCKSLNIHQFHKYSCDTCKKHFHKIETLYRHSQQQHDGNIKIRYFCGLCEDLYFDKEVDFHNHYEGFHSSDYAFVPDEIHAPAKVPEYPVQNPVQNGDRLTCGCLDSYTNKKVRKEENGRCLEGLLKKGHLWYSCCICAVTGQSLKDFIEHNCKLDSPLTDKDFVVKCSSCSKSFENTKSAQSHYHDKHCFLRKPKIQNLENPHNVFRFTASGACVKPNSHKVAHPRQRRKSSGGSETASPEKKCAQVERMDTGEKESDLPDLDFLRTMTHIIFIDLDNWSNIFTHLPGNLNQGTFVWGFQGGKNQWKPPVKCKIFTYLSNTGSFFLHPRCSHRKDAADFAICMHAGRLDEQLPKQMPFTILSGDKGFLELENQFKKTLRPFHILNPHHMEGDMMCALLNSISDTAPGTSDAAMDVEHDEDADMEEAVRRSLEEVSNMKID